MSKGQATEQIKCIAINMPVSLIQKLDEYRAKTGKSKNAALVELIEKGLNSG
jgi:predicted DNA-binding protein